MSKRTRGAAWATIAFLLGVGVSVAANVAHTWHPSPTVLAAAGKTAAQWRPEAGAQAMAAFYPLALLLTIEILARAPWPHSFGWSAGRYGGAAMVAGVAAIVSYRHMSGLLAAYGEDRLTSAIGPLSVDGLMVVASFALLAIGKARTAVPDQVHDQTGRVPGVPEGRPVNGYAYPDRTRVAPLHAVPPAELDPPGDENGQLNPEPDPDPHQIEAARLFADDVTRGEVPSIRRIRDTLKVGQDKARDVKTYLTRLAEM